MHAFISSFRDDKTDFDESKAGQIVRGKTSRADIRELLGRPAGEAIFPLQDEGTTAWSYGFVYARITKDSKKKTYSKTLSVHFDGAGLVSDYKLAISGEK